MSDYTPAYLVAPNYERPSFSPVPKDPPALLGKRAKAAKQKTTDDQEKAKCRARSGGRCEVIEIERAASLTLGNVPFRCRRRANQNHHLIGGIGRRNKGRSILAEHRLDVCDRCHEEITGKVLVPCVPQAEAEGAATVRYERRS